MDELIALAVKALAEKNAGAAGQQSAEPPAERYQRILADLRARTAGVPSAVPPEAPPAQPTRAPVAKPAPPPSPRPQPLPEPLRSQHGPLQGLFEGGKSLLRAVVAAELLDRPLALRENAHWQKR